MPAGLISMGPMHWTNGAQLSMQAQELAGRMAASMDKKINQTSTTKQIVPKVSTGEAIGGVLGGMLGTAIDPLNNHGGGALGAGLGSLAGGGNGNSFMNAYQFGNWYGSNYNANTALQNGVQFMGNAARLYGGFMGGFM